MSIKKNRDGLEVTHYSTAIYKNPPGGGYPDGYNWELHRDMGPQRCEICTRLFSEHTPEEFIEHWEELAKRARESQRKSQGT